MDIEVCEIWHLGARHTIAVRNGVYVDASTLTGALGSPYIAMSYIAMLREADNGTFDPDMWAPTFPALTDEIIEKVRSKARKALSHIPPVLGEIVLSYL